MINMKKTYIKRQIKYFTERHRKELDFSKAIDYSNRIYYWSDLLDKINKNGFWSD